MEETISKTSGIWVLHSRLQSILQLQEMLGIM
jgi:hypothetical protein